MINVANQIKIYEVNGVDAIAKETPILIVSSHWNRDKLVVIKVPGTLETYTVSVGDLQAAIQNAGNSNRNG